MTDEILNHPYLDEKNFRELIEYLKDRSQYFKGEQVAYMYGVIQKYLANKDLDKICEDIK